MRNINKNARFTKESNRENRTNITLTSLRRSLELSASLGATEDVVKRSDARPLSSDVPGSFAIVNVLCNKTNESQQKRNKNGYYGRTMMDSQPLHQLNWISAIM